MLWKQWFRYGKVQLELLRWNFHVSFLMNIISVLIIYGLLTLHHVQTTVPNRIILLLMNCRLDSCLIFLNIRFLVPGDLLVILIQIRNSFKIFDDISDILLLLFLLGENSYLLSRMKVLFPQIFLIWQLLKSLWTFFLCYNRDLLELLHL